jgi:hypothetical protein
MNSNHIIFNIGTNVEVTYIYIYVKSIAKVE